MAAAVAPAAVEAAESLAEATAANTERVAKYLARYQEVQARRTAMEVGPTPVSGDTRTNSRGSST